MKFIVYFVICYFCVSIAGVSDSHVKEVVSMPVSVSFVHMHLLTHLLMHTFTHMHKVKFFVAIVMHTYYTTHAIGLCLRITGLG